MLERLQNYYYRIRDALFNRPELKRPLAPSDRGSDRDRLPISIEQELRQQICSLSPPQAEVDQVLQALSSSLAEWQTAPSVMNHTFVLLHHPGANQYYQLSDVLFEPVKTMRLPFHTLDWQHLPETITDLPEKLRHQIGGALLIQSQEVLAIPNLCVCYLRHAEGLAGINFICETMQQDKNRFWIINVNTICWDYLSVVSLLKACCNVPISPSHLSAETLQSWLEPVLSDFNIAFASDSDRSDSSHKKQDDPQQQYFENLARISMGDRTIATEVFLRSLTVIDGDSQGGKTLKACYPSLPSLPPLEPEDLYIVYALLLHETLTLNTLAQSLGDNLIRLQPRVQKLRQADIIGFYEDRYHINALYYPRLKQSLISNNFMINEEIES